MKIDVSGDGSNNIGVPPAIPRRAANALGIEINGLPILTRIVEYSARTSTTAGPMSLGRYQAHTNVDFFDLETYYRENVILGAGAFIEIANDYDDFARAFLRKLRLEITPLPISRAPPASRPLIRLAEEIHVKTYEGLSARSIVPVFAEFRLLHHAKHRPECFLCTAN